MSRLRELVVLLNERCNLRCDYCHFCAPQPPGHELSLESTSRAVGLFFEAASHEPDLPRTLCFNADGEALLSRGTLTAALVQAARQRDRHGLSGVTIALVTNATLVDAAFARRLARLGVAVTVSMDGASACHDTHRRDVRGAGSHQAVIQGLAQLHRAGVPTSLRAVHSPQTVGQLAQSWSELRGHGPPRPVKLRPVRLPTPPWFEPAWAAQYARAYRHAVRRMVRAGTPCQALPDRARHMAAWLVEGRRRERPCSAGHAMLWLTPAGSLVPCGLLSRGPYSLGHIQDVPGLAELEALLDHPLSAALRDNAPALREPCRSCRWLPGCGGGCPVEALDEKLEPVPPPLCMLYRSLGELLEAELRRS